MENENDKLMRHAMVLFNLAHSYLGSVEIETSEESEETESEETESEETDSRKKEAQKNLKSSKQHNIEEEKGKLVKQQNDNVINHQELEKKTNLEDNPQQLYRDIQQKSYKTLPVIVGTEKYNLKKKVANKSNDKKHKLNIDLPNESNYTIQHKLECGEDVIGEVQEELNKKLHTHDQPKIDQVKELEADEELIKDSEQENNEIQIQLLIEVPSMPGVEEVELYLEVQVDSECQKELDIKKQEALREKQQNIGKEHQNVLDKNIKLIDHKDIQVVNKNVQIKFDEVNISQNNEGDIQDKIIKGSKQNMEEEGIQTELNENLQDGNDIQHNVKELQQEDDEKTQTNIHEETMDEDCKRILQEIDSLICDFKNRKKWHNVNKEEEECDELTAIQIAKITKEIEELEIDMEQKHDEVLEREYNDEVNRMFSSVIKGTFLEDLLVSFQEDAAPYYKRIDNLINNYSPTKFDKTVNEDVIKKSDEGNDAIEQIQEESDKITEEVEQESDVNFFKVIPEKSDIEMEKFENEVVQAMPDIVNEDETQEESDVDVEGLSNSDNEVTGGLDWNLQIESEINVDGSDGQSLQESEEEIEELNEDVNIVTEIVYDYKVEESESSSVVELSPIEKSNSAEIEQTNEEIQQKNDKEGQPRCIGRIHDLQGDVQEKNDNDKPQKFEDLQLQMEIENIQDLDEIPLKLKIQQEQLEEKLHQQMKTFQEEFYKNSKLEYDKEQQLKGNTLNDPVYDRQQKLFYELKNKFLKTKEEYKDLVLQKTIEALQQKVDDKQLLEMKEFPEEFVEPNIGMEDLHKEVLQLQRECTELEPEFSYNIPLVVDEKPSDNDTKEIEYNLYDKLIEIHRKRLRFNVDSKEWPLKYLYPTSLLDQLFDDPSEVNPNFFVITLYTVDIGYSIKITMNKNQPPVETFYSYAEDSILEFVEREQLPPCLLDLLGKARPRLFYNGRVIAEIHNKIPETCEYSVMRLRVARLLLHPHRLTILSDLERIIEQCKPVYCSYEQRLKIESQLLKLNFPNMCMDASPVCGLTLNLQHAFLSQRTWSPLNPLKKINNDSSKFEMDLSKKSQDDKLPTKKLNESQQSSSNLTDTASDNRIHNLLWKFEFLINSFKLIKLYVFVTETREYSMLLCMNSTVPFAKKMRFKINLETIKLKPYIDVILEILKQNVNPDILVVRRYKSDNKSVPQPLTCIPSLLNDNIYEPNSADIYKFLEELLEHIPKIESGEEMPDETKVYKKMESEKKDINFDSKKTSPKNLEINMDQKKKKQVQTVESKKSIPPTVESKKSIPNKVESSSTNRVFVDSKSLRNSTIPIDVSLGLKPLPSLNSVGPSLTGSKSNVLLDDKSINVIHKELDSISAKEIKSLSSTLTILPTVSSHITVVSLTPRYKTIFSSAGLNTDCQLTSKNLERFKDPTVSKDIIHKPIGQTKIDHKKYLKKDDFSPKTSFDNINSSPLNNLVKSNKKSELSSCGDEVKDNIKVVKHIHRNSICVKGPETIVKKEDLPLLVDFSEGRSNKPNTTDYLKSTLHTDDLTTNIHSLSNIKIRYPVTKSLPSSLNKFNNHDQMNDVSFQEINCTSSSNTKDIKSNKRKRSP